VGVLQIYLSGGLFDGVFEIKQNSISEVSAILLLSDGAMNQGIVDKKQLNGTLVKLLDNFTSGKKPTIFTFGFGNDADIETLQLIAQSGGGQYYGITTIEAVPLSFSSVVGGLISTASQNMELIIKIEGNFLEIKNVLTKFKQEKISSKEVKIMIKDMYMGESRNVVFVLGSTTKSSVDKETKKEILENIHVTLRYLDTTLENQVFLISSCKVNILLNGTNEKLLNEEPNVEVMRQYIRVKTAFAMDEAARVANLGDVKKGKVIIDNQLCYLGEAMSQFRIDQDLMTNEMNEDLKQVSKQMESTTSYLSVGKSALASKSETHNYERSIDVDFQATTKTSPYGNSSKVAMMSAAVKKFGLGS